MSKWYVEYKAYGKQGCTGGIEANSGNEAVEIVKSRIIGVNRICGVWHDDEETEKADMMAMIVEDWMFDHREEMADLVLDGSPYYDKELSAWVQDAHDSTTTYVLVDNNGNIDIEYVGTI